jgi:hypothetical protein
MCGATMTNLGLYQLPDEPEPAPQQGSVSQPVSAMGRADAPLSAAARYARGISQMSHPPLSENLQAAIAQWFEDFAAARVAEAVAAERERIVERLGYDAQTHSSRILNATEGEIEAWRDGLRWAANVIRARQRGDTELPQEDQRLPLFPS